MFSVYTTAIIKYIIANKDKTDEETTQLTKAYVFISFAIPSVFIFFITSLILLQTSVPNNF